MEGRHGVGKGPGSRRIGAQGVKTREGVLGGGAEAWRREGELGPPGNTVGPGSHLSGWSRGNARGAPGRERTAVASEAGKLDCDLRGPLGIRAASRGRERKRGGRARARLPASLQAALAAAGPEQTGQGRPWLKTPSPGRLPPAPLPTAASLGQFGAPGMPAYFVSRLQPVKNRKMERYV